MNAVSKFALHFLGSVSILGLGQGWREDAHFSEFGNSEEKRSLAITLAITAHQSQCQNLFFISVQEKTGKKEMIMHLVPSTHPFPSQGMTPQTSKPSLVKVPV